MTALSAWAAKTCEGPTARQLALVELFLNVDFKAGMGWNSWTCMPTAVLLLGFSGFNVEAMKLSFSIALIRRDSSVPLNRRRLF